MLRWIVLLFALLVATPALAHPAPFSYLDIDVKNGAISGKLVVHVIDVAHDLRIASPDALLDPQPLAQRRQEIATLLLGRIALRGDRPLVPHATALSPLADRSALALAFRVPNAASGAITVDPRLFPYDAAHQTFVNVYEAGALKQQWIFNRDSPARTHYLGTAAGTMAVVRTFVAAGIHHILIGPDHLLFLVGLLLLGGGWRALLRIVTAFTIGHSITLSLAALDIVTPPSTLIEPAIALSIVFVGTDNLIRGQGRDLRAWVALVFGLVHGFGFASVLREFGLPREALRWTLFSFNIGVEIGQLAVVAVVASLLAGIRRQSPRAGKAVAVAGSVVVIVAGAYWFVQRIAYPGGA
ncbi:MAG: HupE/UreJ protein [Sphingomonas bacterium]|nr:HupE/UreJ family protein [Sphingomonas bacterium]MDB5690054.1 HupE/UreJ protein [Sphingomonas bacterium]